MNRQIHNSMSVAVIGAGPAGIFAAEHLANQGIDVALINRDIRPGGLAEYGIYHNKHKMKAGLRKQFTKVLSNPNIHYFGNVTISQDGPVTVEKLRQMGFDAILVTVGAQGTKWLDMQGESLSGVYHAKDLVYHYNQLPPFSTKEYKIGKRVAIVGVGNVMIDIAHWLIRDLHVDEVIALARRGAADVKFTKKEMEAIAKNLDLDALDQEMDRISEHMEGVDQDPEAAKGFILSALKRAKEPVSDSKLRFRFLNTPKEIVGNDEGEVLGVMLEENTLQKREGNRTKPVSLGKTTLLPVDTVVFAIGDVVDRSFGLPTEWGSFSKNPNPQHPIDGISYEAYDPELDKPLPGYFVAGWAREASSGLVGAARKDGKNGAEAVLDYLKTTVHVNQQAGSPRSSFEVLIREQGLNAVTFADWQRIEAQEVGEAELKALDHFRFSTNDDMLTALAESAPSETDTIPGD